MSAETPAARVHAGVARVRAAIDAALDRAGRRRGSVTLVAVTKQVPTEAVRAAFAAGVGDVGENRVQEARAKRPALSDLPLRWHMVGRLQRNKVRYVVGSYHLLHSLDRFSLAEEIDRRARRAGEPLDCCLQVNVVGDPAKAGVAEEDALALLRRLAGLEGVRVRGLTTIAPLVDDAERARPIFRRLRLLAERVREEAPEGVRMEHLSMGMSNDFPIAVEEGATLVRIGSAIFGPRAT